MEKETLTISLPRQMKSFITAKVREGRFSTPSEYVRSLIRFDQERGSRAELEAFIRGGLRAKTLPALDEEAWRAVENIIFLQLESGKRTNARNGRQRRPSKD